MILEKKKTAEPLLDVVRGVTEPTKGDNTEYFRSKHFTALRSTDSSRLFGIIEHKDENEAKEQFISRDITQSASRRELNAQEVGI